MLFLSFQFTKASQYQFISRIIKASSRTSRSQKMQSRLAAALATRSNLIFQTKITYQSLTRRGFAKGTTAATPGDTDIHAKDRDQDPSFPSQEPEGIQDVAEPEHEENQEREENPRTETGPFVSPKPPHTSSPKLENPGLSKSSQPNTQQRRTNTTKTETNQEFQQVSCAAGVDGTPWPEVDQENERWQDREEQEKDDKQYFKDHKASPLSEIEMADTRKPITRASDGTAYSGSSKDVIGWLPEQCASAEEVLLKAAEMFKLKAMRGDPESPHGRVLRARLGENF